LTRQSESDVSRARFQFELESNGQKISVPKTEIHTAVVRDTIRG